MLSNVVCGSYLDRLLAIKDREDKLRSWHDKV
jgi:hypothetical protein